MTGTSSDCTLTYSEREKNLGAHELKYTPLVKSHKLLKCPESKLAQEGKEGAPAMAQVPIRRALDSIQTEGGGSGGLKKL